MNERKVLITNKKEIEGKHRDDHEPFEFYKYEVTQRTLGDQSYVAFYEIPPSKSNFPYHYHLRNEEVFYIISGNGILLTPEGEKEIKEGDVIVCPPSSNGAHKILNSSQTEKLTYLDIDFIHSPETVIYPNSNKVGIFKFGEQSKFYKLDKEVNLYDGE